MLAPNLLVDRFLCEFEGQIRQQVVRLGAGLGVGVVADRLFEQFLALPDLTPRKAAQRLSALLVAALVALLGERAVPLGHLEVGLGDGELRLHRDGRMVKPLGERRHQAVGALEH